MRSASFACARALSVGGSALLTFGAYDLATEATPVAPAALAMGTGLKVVGSLVTADVARPDNGNPSDGSDRTANWYAWFAGANGIMAGLHAAEAGSGTLAGIWAGCAVVFEVCSGAKSYAGFQAAHAADARAMASLA